MEPFLCWIRKEQNQKEETSKETAEEKEVVVFLAFFLSKS